MHKCKQCLKWKEHYYWNHFEATSFHFIKVMDSNFYQGIMMPMKFARNFKEKLHGAISLKGPSGKLWRVELLNESGDLFMNKGWKEFVKANHVEEGHTLVFKYDGNASFNVLIFDPSGCENEAAYFSKKLEDDEGRLLSAEILENSSRSSCPGKRKCFNEIPNIKPINPKRRTRDVEHSVEEDSVAFISPGKTPYYVRYASKRRPVTAKERERALRRAENFPIVNPSFIIVMQPTHVYNRFFLTVPSHFSALHLTPQKQIIVLRDPKTKKEWRVMYLKNTGCWGFSLQWKNFVTDNNLEEGDACVFEITEPSGDLVVMDVHVFRVVEEVKPLSKETSSMRKMQPY